MRTTLWTGSEVGRNGKELAASETAQWGLGKGGRGLNYLSALPSLPPYLPPPPPPLTYFNFRQATCKPTWNLVRSTCRIFYFLMLRFKNKHSEIPISRKSRSSRNRAGGGVNLQCSTEWRETPLGSSHQEVRKMESLRNWDSMNRNLLYFALVA